MKLKHLAILFLALSAPASATVTITKSFVCKVTAADTGRLTTTTQTDPSDNPDAAHQFVVVGAQRASALALATQEALAAGGAVYQRTVQDDDVALSHQVQDTVQVPKDTSAVAVTLNKAQWARVLTALAQGGLATDGPIVAAIKTALGLP